MKRYRLHGGPLHGRIVFVSLDDECSTTIGVEGGGPKKPVGAGFFKYADDECKAEYQLKGDGNLHFIGVA